MHKPFPALVGRFGAVLLVAAAALAAPVLARDDPDPFWEYRDEVERGEFSYDDSQDIPWIENETEVLALPQPDQLSRLKLDSLPGDFELYVDKSRITVDPTDRVVRMWLWVRSSAGSETGTFEGYRCATREYKVYAYANPRRDPPVRKAKAARWKPVDQKLGDRYRAEILGDYLCGIRGTRTAHEIVNYMTGTFRRERFMSE